MFLKNKFITILFLCTLSVNVNSIELIRDVELEEFTKEIFLPLTRSSNLEDNRIDFYFIKSKNINAFVTAGQRIFINTELIIQSETYAEYLGVLAHELAHINGGHISRTKNQITELTEKSMPIYLLGILGILGGEANAGIAAMMVGSASVQDGYLYYSRTQEAAADQSAISLLCKANQPSRGLENFLKILERETPQTAKDYQYKTTHPQTSDRYIWLKNSFKKYPNCQNKLDPKLEGKFQNVKAKLAAFTHNKNEVIALYQDKETEFAKYAIAATNFFNGNQEKSINLIKSLINSYPRNPYYHEFLGEIYYFQGDYVKAIKEQKTAMSILSKDNDLHLMMLGTYLIAESSNRSVIESIGVLNKSLFLNRFNSYSWYLLAKAHALNNNLALAQYASAERYYLNGNRSLALEFAKKAIKNIDKDTVEWYRTNDLIELILGIDEKDNKNRT